MKKLIPVLVAAMNGKALLCLLLVLSFFAFAGVASAATIYVPDDYATIQKAVDNAAAGDTIVVRDGIYNENIEVNKRLTLMSENGPTNCIVQAANPDDDVFRITADHVDIIGFKS
ncbi:MAG: PKD repeat domain protein [Candidatus Alkanophagales archaeon MCA70_species_2]|nr:PKD repeat domain protein [Candidatus Alkanophaga liquidiphilum]